MSTTEDNRQEEFSAREKGLMRMRSIMDFGMGTLWMAMGIFLIFVRHFSDELAAKYDDPAMKWFGSICIVYGAFRWFRGIKKNYWKER